MSQYAEGIDEAVITWALFASEYNTSIIPWNPTTGARGSLLGFLSTEDMSKIIDSHLVKLTKQITGSENAVAVSSGGQSAKASFTLQGVDKYTTKILLNEIGDFTGVVKDNPAVGSIKGDPSAGYNATPHRFVFIPQRHLPNGDFKTVADMDLTNAYEIPKGVIMSAYELTTNSEDYASIDVELEALATPGNRTLYIEGTAINLEITP